MDFWGPYYPPLFGETQSEAGGSTFVSTWALFWYRLWCSGASLALGIYGIMKHKTFAHRLDRWVELLTGASFALLSICSFQEATGRARGDNIARIAGPLHHTSCSLAILVLIKFWLARHGYFTTFQIVVNVLPIGAIIADFLLGATLRFRITYIFFPQIPAAFHAVWLNFAWGGWVLHHIGAFLARHIVLVFCAIAACALSRLPALCAAKRQTQASSTDAEIGALQPDRGEGYSW